MPASTMTAKPAMNRIPDEDRIRQKAYDLYLQRGCLGGYELDDWLKAEEEIVRQGEQPVAKA